ncbi:MAG: VapE domain-containing protein, partial [Xenococcaceae cyanobacterium]
KNYWLRKYQHVEAGGWWCNGIDLLTGQGSQWGCFKPDSPRLDKHVRKIVKYETPPEVSTEVFALKVSQPIWEKIANTHRLTLPANGNVTFWDWVKANPRLPIVLTEGAKKAGALMTSGYCAIALPGIDNGSRNVDGNKQLIAQLNVLACPNREFIFAFDSDKKWNTKKHVTAAILRTGRLLIELDCWAYVVEWKPDLGKGADDLIVSQGEDYFHALFEARIRLREYEELKKQKSEYLPTVELLEFMEGEFEDRLSFDELRSEILLDGKPTKLDSELKSWFAKTYGYRCSKEDLESHFAFIAKQNSFNPVKQYLEQCHSHATRIDIDNLATRYFGSNDPLYNTFVRKWLIGAVARAAVPGCQMDYALVLLGKQGQFKSHFFRALGGEFFDDSIKDIPSDDAHLTLDSCWIAELAELDRITRKKEAADVKHFITQRQPRFRKRYDREVSEHPRRTVICGSVNKDEFLIDETGNRRFWVIPVSLDVHRIDIAQLKAERNGIWASAIDAYLAGELPMLDDESELLSEENNKRFEVHDEWESDIESYLEEREEISVGEILSLVFDIEPAKQDKQLQMRATNVLTKLGWKKLGQRERQGKKKVLWVKQNLSKNENQSDGVTPPISPTYRKGVGGVGGVGGVNGTNELSRVENGHQKNVHHDTKAPTPPTPLKNDPLDEILTWRENQNTPPTPPTPFSYIGEITPVSQTYKNSGNSSENVINQNSAEKNEGVGVGDRVRYVGNNWNLLQIVRHKSFMEVVEVRGENAIVLADGWGDRTQTISVKDLEKVDRKEEKQ